MRLIVLALVLAGCTSAPVADACDPGDGILVRLDDQGLDLTWDDIETTIQRDGAPLEVRRGGPCVAFSWPGDGELEVGVQGPAPPEGDLPCAATGSGYAATVERGMAIDVILSRTCLQRA